MAPLAMTGRRKILKSSSYVTWVIFNGMHDFYFQSMRTNSNHTKTIIMVVCALFILSASYGQNAKKLVKEATKLNKERRYEEAIDKLDHALKLDASNAKGFAQRGLAHDQLEKTEAAAKDYAMASSLDGKSADYFYEAGRLHNDIEKHKEAVVFLAVALRLDKKHDLAYHEKVEAHMALRDFYLALEVAQNALNKDKTAQNYFYKAS